MSTAEGNKPMADAIHTATDTALPVYDNTQAWRGPQLQRSGDWIYRLRPDEVAELEAAAAAGLASGRDLTETGHADFPLPGLAPRLKHIRDEVLRGLPIDRLSHELTIWMYWALGTHWGEPCSQNGLGHVLGHVKDLGYDPAGANVRGYHTNARLLYHADRADVVGLLCFKPSKSGGLSSAVSSTAIWNEMVRQRPDLAAPPSCNRSTARAMARYRRGCLPTKSSAFITGPAPHRLQLPWRRHSQGAIAARGAPNVRCSA